MPGCSATTSPMIAASRPSGCARIAASSAVGVLRRDDGDQLPLVGDVERVEPQHLAGAPHLGPERDRRLVELARPPARPPPARSARSTARRASGRACSGCRGHASSIASARPVSGAVSLSRTVSNSSPSRTDMMAMPWSPSVPETRMRSPGRAARIDSDRPSGTMPMPEVVMKTWSPLPRSTTLVSPVTSATPASSHACRIERDDPLQVGQRQPLFEDERRRQEQRPGAADGQVVDRAMHRQPADVAAGEEERPDHERVGREGDARRHRAVVAGAEADGRLVLQRRQHVVAEAGHEEPLDQVGGQLAAAAVAEQDLVVPRVRQRTGAEGVGRSSRVAHAHAHRDPPDRRWHQRCRRLRRLPVRLGRHSRCRP